MTEAKLFSRFIVGKNVVDEDVCSRMVMSNVWTRGELLDKEFIHSPNIFLHVVFTVSPSSKLITVHLKEYVVRFADNESVYSNLDLAKNAVDALESKMFASMFGGH